MWKITLFCCVNTYTCIFPLNLTRNSIKYRFQDKERFHGAFPYVWYGFLLVCYRTFSLREKSFWDIRLDLETWVSGSLKVIGIDMDQSASCDFVLTFHSCQGPISYRFQDKERFQWKITKFPHPPRVFCAHAGGVPLELGSSAWGQKTRMMGLPGRERSLTMSSAVWIQYTNVMDRQMDGHCTCKDRAYT